MAPTTTGDATEVPGGTSRGAPPGPATREDERFRLLAENASDIIYLYRVRPSPSYEYISPSVTRITGYTPEEHYQDPELTLKMAHPHDRPLLAALLRAPSAFGEPVTIRLIRKDG